MSSCARALEPKTTLVPHIPAEADFESRNFSGTGRGWAGGDRAKGRARCQSLSQAEENSAPIRERHAAPEVFETDVYEMLPIPQEVGTVGVSVGPMFRITSHELES